MNCSRNISVMLSVTLSVFIDFSIIDTYITQFLTTDMPMMMSLDRLNLYSYVDACRDGKSTRANGYLGRIEEQLKIVCVESVVFDKVQPIAAISTIAETGSEADVGCGGLNE